MGGIPLECNLREFKQKVENAPQPLVLKAYVLGWADKCLGDVLPKNKTELKKFRSFEKSGGETASKSTKKKKKRAPSEYNKFISKCMAGCGDERPCSEQMKVCAAEWKKQKK